MTTFTAERPRFFEGQYLGAADLASIVDYLRTTTARQNLGQHSWGVAIGLNLVAKAISDIAVEYYVQPGVAIDGYGRIIVVNNPERIEPEKFVSISSGNVDIWLRYQESDFAAVRKGFNACSAQDQYARISERFAIEVGSKSSILDRLSGVTVNDTLLVDAREALISVDPDAGILCDGAVPHQQLPVDDDKAYWLIPLGHVKWSAAANSFLPLVDPAEAAALENGTSTKTPDQVYEAVMASRTKRRLIGAVAESIFAAEGIIRLRERTVPQDPAKEIDAVCNGQKIHGSDLQICDGSVKPKEPIWLEGNTRIIGDVRLLHGRLEFKDEAGKDYVERTIEGNNVSAITPLLLQRVDGNARGGADLQVMLGESTHGINRLSIGSIKFAGKDLGDLTISSENKVVIQDNGRVGIGTVNPDSQLSSPCTVRGIKETIIENEGTEDEEVYDIYRLESFEGVDGSTQWQLDLWNTQGTARKSLNFTESNLVSSRLFLEAGGNIGVGTTEPSAQLHIRGDHPALFIDINPSSGFHNTELNFGSDGTAQAKVYWSKSVDKVFVQHKGVNAMVIDEEKIGLGTGSPATTLHIATGNDVKLNDDSGYLLLGDTAGLNVVLDNNEIQARNNGVASQLHLQVEGGDFSVHWNDDTEFRIKDNGNVGIGTNNPGAKLDVRGDIKLGSSGDLFAMAGVENLRTIVGRVSLTGNIDQGAGFTINKGSTGDYTINFIPAFSSDPVVVANSYNKGDSILSVLNITSASCEIRVTDIRDRLEDILDPSATEAEDGAFTFIAVGER